MLINAVAPFAGAWIEMIYRNYGVLGAEKSLPSRERGLKSSWLGTYNQAVFVAPFAGAWIEISLQLL